MNCTLSTKWCEGSWWMSNMFPLNGPWVSPSSYPNAPFFRRFGHRFRSFLQAPLCLWHTRCRQCVVTAHRKAIQYLETEGLSCSNLSDSKHDGNETMWNNHHLIHGCCLPPCFTKHFAITVDDQSLTIRWPIFNSKPRMYNGLHPYFLFKPKNNYNNLKCFSNMDQEPPWITHLFRMGLPASHSSVSEPSSKRKDFLDKWLTTCQRRWVLEDNPGFFFIPGPSTVEWDTNWNTSWKYGQCHSYKTVVKTVPGCSIIPFSSGWKKNLLSTYS